MVNCTKKRTNVFLISIFLRRSVIVLVLMLSNASSTLWRIYFTDKQSSDSILCEGFDFKNHHISVYDSNPYSAGLEHPSGESLKVTICGVPLSFDDSAILEMLSKLGAHPKKQACQLTKAIRTGNLVAADKIRDAKSALECSNTVTNTPRWGNEADNVMEKILCAKIDQLKEMNDLLASSRPHTIFAHSVYDLYWGTGLDSEKPAHTAPDAWSGQNKFGKLLQRTKPRSVSMSRAVKTRQQGIGKYTC
uniref:NADAR domain-containing protein n=1 Tax=Magallana gigas TaxID=29159 RepID=A0A8W8KE61_MAGGI